MSLTQPETGADPHPAGQQADATALAAEAAAALGLGVPMPLAGPLNRASDLPEGSQALAAALTGPSARGRLVLALLPGAAAPGPEAWTALAASFAASAGLAVGPAEALGEATAELFAGHALVAAKHDDARAAVVGVQLDGRVAAPDLPPLDAGTAAAGPARSLASLSDVAMGVTVELGRTTLTVRDLLGLHTGAVIQLDQEVGTAAEIFVNGTHIGSGEVVVVDGDYGIRVTRLVGTD